MLRFLVFILLFSSAEFVSAANYLISQDSDDPGPNIPSIGSSLFDKVYSKKNQSGETVYDIPQIPSGFIQKLHANGAGADYTFFPFSRSLQRPHDLSYDPLLNPRLVFAATFSTFDGASNPIFPMKMFFGYVKAKDQMEVISFNDEAGRFEFQIVTDVSTNPKVYYADRAKCFSCHQNQAAIFAQASWPDSTFGIGGELVAAKLGLRYDSGPIAMATGMLFGGDWPDAGPASIDVTVELSNFISTEQREWIYGCGSDNSCRLGSLLNFLAPDVPQSKDFMEHARVVREGKSYVQYRHDFLSEKFEFALETIAGKFKDYAEAVNTPSAVLEMIGAIYNLIPDENPATPKPESRPGGLYYSSNLDKHRELISSVPRADIANALLSLYEKKSPIFEQRAMNASEIMFALLTELKSEKASLYSPWLNRETPKKALYAGVIPPTFSDNRLNRFSRHCAQCHASESTSFPPQFLIGTEEAVVKKIARLKSKMIFKLEKNQMPTTKDARELLHSSGDYDVLLDYLKAL